MPYDDYDSWRISQALREARVAAADAGAWAECAARSREASLEERLEALEVFLGLREPTSRPTPASGGPEEFDKALQKHYKAVVVTLGPEFVDAV